MNLSLASLRDFEERRYCWKVAKRVQGELGLGVGRNKALNAAGLPGDPATQVGFSVLFDPRAARGFTQNTTAIPAPNPAYGFGSNLTKPLRTVMK